MSCPVDYAPPAPRAITHWFVSAAALVGIAGTGAAAGITAFVLWTVPGGTAIRPMGLVFFMFIIAAITLFLVVLLLLVGLLLEGRDGRGCLVAFIALILGVGPLPAFWVTADTICAIHSLVWDD